MAATGKTPIQLYRTTTAAAVPNAADLAAGELAINLTDEKLYFKNAAGTVKLLATSAITSGTVTSVSGTGSVNGITLTGTVTSSGSLTLGGTLSGVSLTSQVSGTLPVGNGGTGLTTVGTAGNVLTSNGSAWVSQAAGGGANLQSFTSSGTWTKPSGAQFVMVECWGAGGGGAGGSNDYHGQGGGGGGYSYAMFAAPQLGSTETVTVGAGGAGGASGAGAGGNGGNSNFGTYLYAGGGIRGTSPAVPTPGLNGGWSFAPGASIGAYSPSPSVPSIIVTHQIHGGAAPTAPTSNQMFYGTFGGGNGGYTLSQKGANSMFGGGGGGIGANAPAGYPGSAGGARSAGAIEGSGAAVNQPGAPLGYFFGGGGGNAAPGQPGGVAAGGGGASRGFYTGGAGGSGLVHVYSW